MSEQDTREKWLADLGVLAASKVLSVQDNAAGMLQRAAALIREFEPAEEPCPHEAWEEAGGCRRCVDCRVPLARLVPRACSAPLTGQMQTVRFPLAMNPEGRWHIPSTSCISEDDDLPGTCLRGASVRRIRIQVPKPAELEMRAEVES